uniref:Uncharacterized protein n=1 Tax=Romanomermis culicivorax TaxID=13658 RepID=A0A915KSA3_ROMCU
MYLACAIGGTRVAGCGGCGGACGIGCHCDVTGGGKGAGACTTGCTIAGAVWATCGTGAINVGGGN